MIKKFLLFFSLSVYSLVAVCQDTPAAKHYGDLISTADLKEYLSIIASDALEGRETGTRGQKMAAAFIAAHFQELGLTAPVNGSYYQPIDLYSSSPGEAYVKAGNIKFDNFSGIAFSGSLESGGEVSLPVVFAGNGTEQDFNQVDVKDKAVFFFSKEARLTGSKSVTMAKERGAKLILVNNTETPADFDATATAVRNLATGGRLSLTKPSVATQQAGLVLISPAVIEKIMGVTPDNLKKAAAQDPSKNALRKIKPTTLQYKSTIGVKITKSENVLGYMEGSDKKDELVVISAHYDHIGVIKNPAATVTDKINNGADDDGSGTVSVLELAKIFAQAKLEGKGPRRSILFMTVTGEEKGLLGSSYYTDHPVFPLENTVVDLNIDMVGRRDPQHKESAPYVYVIGSDKLATDLHTLSESVNKRNLNMIFDYTYNEQSHPERIYYRSDHWNFAKNNIPIIFYFDGIHEDYHKPGDEVNKIEFDLLTKRAQVIFYTAWEIANQDKRIIADPDKMIKK